MNMIEVKIGVFPGKINTYTLEEGITVEEALKIAGLSVGAEQECKLDDEVVDMDYELDEEAKMLLITKRMKGNAIL